MRTCVGLSLSLLFLAGCLPTTTVFFKSPAGTTMKLGLVEYQWPREVEFKRPRGNSGVRSYPVTLILPKNLGGERLAGEIHIPAVQIDDGLVCTEIRLLDKDIARLKKGKPVMLEGPGAGTDKVVCVVVLKADKK